MPKDLSKESLLQDTDLNENILSEVRNALVQGAKVSENFPSRPLIKIRKTRAGISLEYKLALDWHYLFWLIPVFDFGL